MKNEILLFTTIKKHYIAEQLLGMFLKYMSEKAFFSDLSDSFSDLSDNFSNLKGHNINLITAKNFIFSIFEKEFVEDFSNVDNVDADTASYLKEFLEKKAGEYILPMFFYIKNSLNNIEYALKEADYELERLFPSDVNRLEHEYRITAEDGFMSVFKVNVRKDNVSALSFAESFSAMITAHQKIKSALKNA